MQVGGVPVWHREAWQDGGVEIWTIKDLCFNCCIPFCRLSLVTQEPQEFHSYGLRSLMDQALGRSGQDAVKNALEIVSMLFVEGIRKLRLVMISRRSSSCHSLHSSWRPSLWLLLPVGKVVCCFPWI